VRRLENLPPAVLSASEVLEHHCDRHEVFARAGTTVEVRLTGRGRREHRINREVGVACRAVRAGSTSFAAASGAAARSGREAARACLSTLTPGTDPLPPAHLLGVAGGAAEVEGSSSEEVEAFALRLADAAARRTGSVELLDLRVTAARAETVLVRGEGHLAQACSSAVTVELLLAAPEGPARLYHVAASGLAILDPDRIVENAVETVLLLARGGSLAPRLADAVIAPAVAAELVGALARYLLEAGLSGSRRLAGAHVSPAWELWDERAGPGGLFPLPFDGEGLPARSVALVSAGHRHEPALAWQQAMVHHGTPGGAVRLTYRYPPVSGLANLIVAPDPANGPRALLERLEDGLYLALPHGTVRSDADTGRFALRVGAVEIRQSCAVAAYPDVEVRGSFRRLLATLEARGADSTGFALGGAVTTPSLLVRRLEVG
jgi:predicted Zn-dependent protease